MNSIRYLFVTFFFWVFVFEGVSQSEDDAFISNDLSFNLQNNHLVNPAFAGHNQGHDVIAQYANLNPSFQPFIDSFYRPQFFNLMYDVALLKNKQLGIGLVYQNYKGGIRKLHLFNLAVSYKLQFAEDHFLRLGTSYSYSNYNFKNTRLFFDSPYDPIIFGNADFSLIFDGSNKLSMMHAGFGLHYVFKGFYFNAVASGIQKLRLDLLNDRVLNIRFAKNVYQRGIGHLQSEIGLKTKLNNDLAIRTEFAYQFIDIHYIQPSVHLLYKDKYSLGFSSNHFYDIRILMGVKLLNKFSIGAGLAMSTDSFIRQFGFLSQAQLQMQYKLINE
jgi:hypothetical protein